MTSLTPRQRTALLVVGVVYTAVVIPIGVHKGGDLVAELLLSDRWISGNVPLYAHAPSKGTYWPPFAIFGLVPFALVARLSLVLAKALFAAANVALLGWSAARLASGWGWKPVVIAIVAVGKPLQGTFENLNITIVILALVVAAAADLSEGHERRAGVWVGLASAIKAFPALLLVYFAYRRCWRAFFVGCAVAAGATFVPMLRFGPVEALTTVRDWLLLGQASQRAVGFGYQPLGFMVTELGGSVTAVWIVAGVLTVLVFVAVSASQVQAPLYEKGMVMMLAVLVSPIAWFHYHVLAIPAWVAALSQAPLSGWRGRGWTIALAFAGVFLSGVLSFGLYPDALLLVRHHNYVWGALILIVAMVWRRLDPAARSSPPAQAL